MNKKALLTAFALFVSGCAQGNTGQSEALNDGEYVAILPYETSDTRAKHIGLIYDADVRYELELGLMDLSKQYFSPNDVAFKTHTFLDFDELDATDGSRGLLGTLRDDNPNGLNPNNNDTFDTGNGIVQGGIILVDIYELDWYKNDTLQGISLGLAVVDTLTYNGEEYKIEDEQLKNYLQVTASKLVSYMRERFNEVSSRVPIFVAGFCLNSDSDTDSLGNYIYEGYFPAGSSTGQYSDIDQANYTVPSSSFTAADPNLAAQFNTFKEDVANVLSDNTYVVGECKFQDGKAVKLKLTVTTHGKTMSEILAATQAIRQSLSVFTDTDVDYRVTVQNDNDVFALLHRPADSTSVSIVTSA
jgi:protein involved in sex pheromone biosynthesis